MAGLSLFSRPLREHDPLASNRHTRSPSLTAAGLSTSVLPTPTVSQANMLRVDHLKRKKNEVILKQELECKKIHDRAAELEAECNTLRNSLDSANATVALLTAERDSLSASLESEKCQVASTTAVHERLVASSDELSKKITRLEAARDGLSNSLNAANVHIAKLQTTLNTTSRDLANARNEADRLRNECNGLNARLKTAVRDAVNGIASQQSQKMKATFETLRSQLETTEGRVKELSTELATHKTQLSQANKTRASAEATNVATQAMLKSAYKKISEVQSETSLIARRRDELAGSVASLEHTKTSLEATLSAAKLACSTTEQALRLKARNLAVAHVMLRSCTDEIVSLRQQVARSELRWEESTQRRRDETNALRKILTELQSRTDAQLEETRSQLDAERKRAKSALGELEELRSELARQLEQNEAERGTWQEQISAAQMELESEREKHRQQLVVLNSRLDAANLAQAKHQSLLDKAHADRDVYQAQAREALAALSSMKHDSEKQAQVAAAAHRAQLADASAEREKLERELRDAAQRLEMSDAAAKELEQQKAALAAELAARDAALAEAQAELQRTLECSRAADTSACTLVADLADDAHAVGALKEAVQAYAAAIDEFGALCKEVEAAEEPPLVAREPEPEPEPEPEKPRSSAPLKKKKSNRWNPMVASSSRHDFGNTFVGL